jgi:hypothetical protein
MSDSGTGGNPQPADELPADETYRVRLDRVSSQGGNRFQVATFLGGITLAAYAALQAPGTWRSDTTFCNVLLGPCFFHIPSFTAAGHRVAAISDDQLSLVIVHFFLGLSAVVFLLALLLTYNALHHVGYLTKAELGEPRSYEKPILIGFSNYRVAGKLIYLGVILLLLSLAVLACRLSVASSIVSVVLLTCTAVYAQRWRTKDLTLTPAACAGTTKMGSG